MRQMEKNYKGKMRKKMQRNIGTGKDAEMIKENKTNNKIR